MNFSLNQLRIFLKIVETRSITRASQELALTQPAVSIQLKNFQDQFDVPLTQLINRRLFITEFGYEIAGVAEKIMNDIHEIAYKSSLYKGQIAGKLKISVVSTGKYVIPYFLTDFLTENPNVDLMLDVSNKAQVISDLRENTVDFSLVSTLPKDLNLEKITLMKNELFLVCSATSSLEKIQSIKDLPASTAFIYRELGSATRTVMEKYIEKQGVSIHKKLELTSNEAVKQAVIANMGISIMPIIGIRQELLSQQLKIIALNDLPIETHWHIVWNKGTRLTPTAKAFIEHVQKNKNSIIQSYFT
jgi:DNA-binding transcriptional LysR family regulator